jgi:hypothetical protein
MERSFESKRELAELMVSHEDIFGRFSEGK